MRSRLHLLSPYVGSLSIGPDDDVHLRYWHADEASDVRAMMRRQVPAFPWTFAAMDFSTECPSPY